MKPINSFLSLILILCIVCNLNAQTWESVGTGTDNSVYTLKSFKDGLAIGGNFKKVDDEPLAYLAYMEPDEWGGYWFSNTLSHAYDESAWMGNIPGVAVYALEEIDDRLHMGGKLYYYNYFDPLHIGYHEYDDFSEEYNFHIYYGAMTQFEWVQALQFYDNKLFIGGYFQDWLGTYNIAYIESGDYPSPFPKAPGGAMDDVVQCFAVYNGELYAGGDFLKADNVSVNHIAKWNGTEWKPVGGGVNGSVYAMQVYNNQLIVGGSFTDAGGVAVNNIAKWDGSSWSAMADGLSGGGAAVFALEVYGKNLYAGGDFSNSGNTTVNSLAKWVGFAWTNVGDGVNDDVWAMEVFDGSLYIGGDFTQVNGVTHNHIVSYNDGSIGISDLANPSQVEVYPNPAQEVIFIKTESIITTATVSDVVGSVVKTYSGTALNQLDVSTLNPGIYLIQMTDSEGNQLTQRIFKE